MKSVLNFVYCQLAIVFVILKQAVVIILIVMATKFEKSEILMKNSINLLNLKQI